MEVARDRKLYRQTFSRGTPTSKLVEVGPAHNRRGTQVRFHPDPEIFGDKLHFKPARLFPMARSKAYLQRGRRSAGSAILELIKDATRRRRSDAVTIPTALPTC